MNPGILASGYAPPPMPYGQTRLAGVIPRQINPDALVLVFDTRLEPVFDTRLEPANNTVSVPLNGTVNCTIDWGDGTSSRHTTTGFVTKTYENPGVYVVQITGTMTTLTYGTGTAASNNRTKLVRCLSFGNVGLASASSAFRSCNNLIEVPSSLPRSLTNLQFMFQSATKFNHPIGSWDTSLVTLVTGMFSSAASFNQPIGSWNMAKVASMSTMFANTSAFNQDISGWDTAAVSSMSAMFQNSTAFNQPVGSWNTANVTDMSNMFGGAASFNQPIGSWNMAKVASMFLMCNNATAFNQDVSGWDIRLVSTMINAFLGTAWSTGNYSAALIAWSALPDTNVGGSRVIQSAASDAGGVLFTTSATHALSVGATVTISGTTNYNGTYRVNSVPSTSSFVVSATFVTTQTGSVQTRRVGGVTLGVPSGAKYTAAAAASRGTLVNTYNWVITDGGPE